MTGTAPQLTGKGVASIGRNALFLVSGNAINHLVRFVYMVVLAGALGPGLYGLYKYAMSWYLGFLVFTGMGLGTIMGREIGRDRQDSSDVLSLTFTLQCLVVLAAGALCAGIGMGIETDPVADRLILVLSVALVGRALAQWAQHAFTAYEAAKAYLYLQAVFRPMEVAVGLTLLWLDFGVTAIVVLHGVSWWFQAATSLALIRSRFLSIHLNFKWKSIGRIIAQGVPIATGAVLIYWLGQGSLILFRHTPDADADLGQLALVMTAFGLISGATMTASTAALPVLSRSVSRKDQKDTLYGELLLRAAIVFGSLAALLASAVGPWLVNAVFGSDYAKAGLLLGPVMWLVVPWSCGIVLWGIFMARGQFVRPMLMLAAGAAVLTLSLPPLVARWGVYGAVAGNGLGLGVWALTFTLDLVRTGELRLGHAVLKPGGAAILAVCVYLALTPVNPTLAIALATTTLLAAVKLTRSLTLKEFSVFSNLLGHR